MISCQLHDYLEIACMYKLPVEVQLKNGMLYQGAAVDITVNKQGRECLILNSTGEVPPELLLTDLKKMRANVSNPHFDEVNFSE